MSRIFEPGDVTIKRIELTNKNIKAGITPMDQILGVDIFEDITKPTLYATVFFNDNIGLLESFPIIGEEEIIIEFQTPGIKQTTTYKFKSFEVADVARDVSGKGVTFTLRCVSEEHLYNGSQLIKQSYETTLSNIVPDILSTYLYTKKPIIIDDTKGIQTIAFPKMNPLQSIDMCRSRAVSKQYPSSAYVFFENQAGFNFKTIEGLVKDGKTKIGSRVFNAQRNTSSDPTTQAKSYRTIINYQNITTTDSNKKASEGVYKAVTKTFNLSSKEFTTENFNLKDVFAKLETFDKKNQIPNSDEFIEKYGSGIPKHFFVPKDDLRPDNFIDTMVAVRNAFSVLLNSNITRVLIHGDSGLKVGDMVTLDLPSATGTTDRKKDDKMVSGNYLITRLRHMITLTTKSKHEIVFDCVSIGL